MREMVGSAHANGCSYSPHIRNTRVMERGLCVILVQTEPHPLHRGLMEEKE